MNKRSQQGASLLIVLVMLMVLLLGALSMARLNESTSMIVGNIAFKDASVQASEVGISEAFAKLMTVENLEQDQGGWYFATSQGDDAAGLPVGPDWTQAGNLHVGKFEVRYLVERLCTGVLPIQDLNAQCVIKKLATAGSAKAALETLETPAARQYRITVFVTGPKNTKTHVQTMVVS